MTIRLWVVRLVLAALAIFPAAGLQAEVLLFEDFEKADLKSLPKSWEPSSKKDITIITDEKQGKVLSVKHATGKSTGMNIQLEAKKAAGHVVRFAALIKFPGNYTPVADKPSERPKLCIEAKKADKVLESKEGLPEPNTATWQKIEATLSIPAEADGVLLQICIPGVAAEILADCVSAELDPAAGSSPPTNAIQAEGNTVAGNAPKHTLDDGALIFNPELAKRLQLSVGKAGSNKQTMAFVGPGLPNKEFNLKVPLEWTQALNAKEFTGATATPRALLSLLPEALAKEKPEIVVLFADVTATRKVSPSELYDWQDVARLCLRLGTVPVFAVPLSVGDKEDKDPRHIILKAVEDSGAPAVEAKVPTQVQKRVAEMGQLVGQYVFGRAPAAKPKPVSGEEE